MRASLKATETEPPFAIGELALLAQQPLVPPVEVIAARETPWRDGPDRQPVWRVIWRNIAPGYGREPARADVSPYRERRLASVPAGYVKPPEFDWSDEAGSLRAQLAWLDEHDDVLLPAIGRERLHQVGLHLRKRLAACGDEAWTRGLAEAAELGNMNRHQFLNRLLSLYNIDADRLPELEEARAALAKARGEP